MKQTLKYFCQAVVNHLITTAEESYQQILQSAKQVVTFMIEDEQFDGF